MAWFHKVGVAVDELGNVIANGKTDETISSRWARARLRGAWYGRLGCWILGVITRSDHCSAALKGDAARAKAELNRDPSSHT